MKRDTQEFFDWWYERIAKFEKMYPYFHVCGWGEGVSVQLRNSEHSVHLPTAIFLKMIGEDKFWWEY